MGQYRDRIAIKLTSALQPSALDIHDDSHRHAGHAGDNPDGNGETHFKVTAVSAIFVGKSRVERQRLVYGVLADELKERIHALELILRAPGEI
jgi:BolA protein